MEIEIIRELTRAYQLLKEGKHKDARPILVRVLKDAPDNEQAWLLLSVAVADRRRQIYALQQVLRINPGNDKALARLEKIQASKGEKTGEGQLDISFEATEDDVSLLEQRIFGWEGDSQEHEQTAEPEAYADEAAEIPATTAVPTRPVAAFELEAEPEPEPEPDEAKDRGNRILEFLRSPRYRKWFIGAGVGLVALIVVLVGYSMISRILGDGNGDISLLNLIGSDPTPTPTIGFRQLPPTYTPTATVMSTGTLTPTPTAMPSPTVTPVPLAPEIVAEMEEIQQQVSSIRGLEIVADTSQYIFSQAEMESKILGTYLDDRTIELLENQKRILIALGLMSPAQNLNRYFINKMVDPRGGIYRPEANEIMFTGIDFSGVEQAVYTRGFDQALVDQHYDFGDLGFSPGCLILDQQCQVMGAVIRGDSMLAEEQWLNQYADDAVVAEIAGYTPPVQFFSDEFAPIFNIPNNQFSYQDGYDFVRFLFDQGGWEQVNQAYVSPPASSEQIMHPDKYLSGESPVALPDASVGDGLSSEWELIGEGSLGEWFTYLILRYSADGGSSLSDEVSRAVAEGWGGDRFQAYYHRDTDDVILAGQWTWDTTEDADDFVGRMDIYQFNRYDSELDWGGGGSCWQSEQQVSCTFVRGERTLWILAPSIDLLGIVKEAYPDF